MTNELYDHPYYRALRHTSKRAAPYMLEADIAGQWEYRPHRRLLIVSPMCTDAGLAVGLATALVHAGETVSRRRCGRYSHAAPSRSASSMYGAARLLVCSRAR